MSVRSFHSVFMASVVAGAALGCYMVSLRVATERASLEDVETRIVETQSDIRLLQTEIGTRGRLSQLERWNVRALALSAPSAQQILGDKFQLAKLVEPRRKLDVEAPVALAAAPAPRPRQPLADDGDAQIAPVGELLHEASLKLPDRQANPAKSAAGAAPKPAVPVPAATKTASTNPAGTKIASTKTATTGKKAGDKAAKASTGAVTRPLETAKIDPLAPLSGGHSIIKGSRAEK